MKTNLIHEKSFAFALRIVKLYKYLRLEKKEFVLSKQILRSGTSIGALAHEASHAESSADFIHKLSIAQKEANETLYWLKLIHQSEYLDEAQFNSILPDLTSIQKILASIILTSKSKQPKKQ
jgi:four helix bundle protein